MPLVAEVLTTELIAGRQFEPGDFLIIKPGSYVRGMFELPQDLAQIVKVDQEGKIRFFYPDQRDQLARAVGMEPPPRPPRSLRKHLSIVR